jgi:site-specific DNA recombinase
MKTVALYARVSSEQQAQQATVESQIAALKRRAEADGHLVLPNDIYVDEGFSGATLIRPALERLRDRAAEGGLDLLYVHSPDRLARRYAYQVLLLEELTSCGVQVVFDVGPSGQSAEDELLVQVQGMIAEYERAKIMERCRRGKLHRARQGMINPLSGAPYGYLYVRKSEGAPANYQILLHEAKTVRRIFDSLVRDQKPIARIVRELNADAIPTRRGAPRWDRTTVWAILRNPAYMGKAAYGKTECAERGQLLRPIRGKNPTPRRARSTYRDKNPEEWILVDVPPIVSADIFTAAGEQLERNKRLSERNGRGERYLLRVRLFSIGGEWSEIDHLSRWRRGFGAGIESGMTPSS